MVLLACYAHQIRDDIEGLTYRLEVLWIHVRDLYRESVVKSKGDLDDGEAVGVEVFPPARLDSHFVGFYIQDLRHATLKRAESIYAVHAINLALSPGAYGVHPCPEFSKVSGSWSPAS